MKLIQSVAPTSEPVELIEMKNFLRVLHDNDDALIESYIIAAREKAESIMNIQLIECTYELYFDAMANEIVLPRPPLVSLVSFEVLVDATTWSDVTESELDDKSTPALLCPVSWPTISPAKNGVKVVYKSGYADASKVPKKIIAWIRFEVAKMYDQEESRVNVDSLLNSFRVIPL